MWIKMMSTFYWNDKTGIKFKRFPPSPIQTQCPPIVEWRLSTFGHNKKAPKTLSIGHWVRGLTLHLLCHQSQGCQVGSILQRLSKWVAASMTIVTLDSPPSKAASPWSLAMIVVMDLVTIAIKTSPWTAASGCKGSSWWCLLLHQAMASSRRMAFKRLSTL